MNKKTRFPNSYIVNLRKAPDPLKIKKKIHKRVFSSSALQIRVIQCQISYEIEFPELQKKFVEKAKIKTNKTSMCNILICACFPTNRLKIDVSLRKRLSLVDKTLFFLIWLLCLFWLSNKNKDFISIYNFRWRTFLFYFVAH